MPNHPDHGFARLFSESQQALTRYVRRLVRTQGNAEEIVQEAFLRTYRYGNPSEPLRPYLFSIARNLASKARRHDRVVDSFSPGSLDPALVQSTCESPEEVALADERMRLLNDAIQSLPPQCRAVFTLRMFQEQPYKEIAQRLGISTKTVEKHIAAGVSGVHAALVRKYKEGTP